MISGIEYVLPAARWSVPAPLAMTFPFSDAWMERRISSSEFVQSRPMPRCAVSIASATPKPQDQRWRR